ncbi:M48 family metalloprotease [Bacteroides acidifaciens]|uniref:M48 family metalloprotease n=1 Tax=Bacteroides acidifaciens TaxID=85831 RepID=UPI0026F2286D|nr:M48 family metallopeptidase [Bacteroides acidifaciens]
MKHRSTIKSAVIEELLRICCFLFYYIILIVIGAAILVGAFWASYHLILDVLPEVHNVRAMILIIMAVIGICLLALMLGIYLIKPLFSFSKNSKNTRVEVFESECPELFAMIRDLASNTQCQMPKHVYLSPDVNACVFYNTSFWSIFFPVRKNLEIGLGLFDGTSIDEVKSIIAHEFGHFSQNSMKIGSTVYVTNTVLHNLILTDDFWDKWLDKWCMSDTGIIRYFGVLTRGITNLIKRQTIHVYRFVQKGYLKLSRYMEYDADSIACQYVGTNTFISALCKIEVLANKDNLYHQMLKSLTNEQKMVSNYFAGKDIISKLIPNKEIVPFTFDCELSDRVRTHNIESRVRVEDIWASHPSLEDRIANALAIKTPSTPATSPMASWTLIPQEISEKVSTLFTSIIRSNVQDTLSYISDEQFTEWASNEIKENFMDERLRPFFGDTIFEFDLEHIADTPLESPFTEENALKIAELIVRIEDWQLLNQVKNKEIDAKEVQLDGKVYNRKNIPFEKVKIELDIIHAKVVEIYSNIYAYVCSKCDEDKQKTYRSAFMALFYAQHIRRELLPSLFTYRDNLLNELNRATRRDEDEYKQLCSWVMDYEQHLKRVISELDLDWISATIDAEKYINNLKVYLNSEHNSRYQINTDTITEMFNITDSLSNIQGAIYGIAIRTICDISTSVLDK